MTAQSSVLDLGRQLLQAAAPELLALPLPDLAAQLPVGRAREAVLDLLQAGVADCLREALVDDRLDRFARESCTQREEESLCLLLFQLLGQTSTAGSDDAPQRLVAPPRDRDRVSLRAWVVAHHGQDLLALPISRLLAEDPQELPTVSVSALLFDKRRRGLPGSDPLREGDLQDRVAQALIDQVRLRAAPHARGRLWRNAPAPTLTSLAARLRALAACTDDDVQARLLTLRFLPAHPVTVDVASGVARSQLTALGETPREVQLKLLGHEQRGLTGRCSCAAGFPCDHVRALSARLLDACLDREDRLHAPLLEFARKPSWQRFVDALENRVDEARGPARAQLFFRLHLNLDSATLGCEMWTPGPRPRSRRLTAMRALSGSSASDADRPILEAMASASRARSQALVPVDPLLLRTLTHHPRVLVNEGAEPHRVAETTALVTFKERGDGVEPIVSIAGSPRKRAPSGGVQCLLHHDPASRTLHFCQLSPAVRRLLQALEHFPGVLPRESFAALSPHLVALQQVAQVRAPEDLLGFVHPSPDKLLLRFAQGPGESLEATLSCRPLPLGPLYAPGIGPAVTHGLVAGKPASTRRDLDWERELAQSLVEELGLTEHPQVMPFSYRIENPQGALSVLSRAAGAAEQLEIEWSEGTRRLSMSAPIRRSDLHVRIRKRGYFLETEAEVVLPEARVSLTRLLDAARRGERFVRVCGDSYAELEQALHELLLHAGLCPSYSESETASLSLGLMPLLAKLPRDNLNADPEAHALLERLRDGLRENDEHLDRVGPAFREQLRPYQAKGASFLLGLSEWAPGACLADEMGLGKTIQTLAVLDARAALGPALVIAPTSIIDNWVRESERFGKGLRARAYRGEGRAAALPDLRAGDVLVASYELVHRDRERLKDVRFATLVLDEAQWVRNAHTARARTIRKLQAQFRIALSGTPVENRLGDLWSLFAVVAPGLLGTWQRFRALFAVPIERYGDAERAESLRSLIAPFMLRRTKDQVLTDLPPRTEVIHRVQLSNAERDLYQAAAAEARHAMQQRSSERVHAAHVLSEITRLRLLACHPALVIGDPGVGSSKLEALKDLVSDLMGRGHRALIFSQFVRHLSLVRQALDGMGIPHLYLDGRTKGAQRSELIERFQTGTEPLFLISLKAGGTGLNLTAADYVIHLDPWWNPAAEDQASDRAHRIGQQRPLTIVKLIAADTIEERVLSLHTHKRDLAMRMLGPSGGAGRPPLDLEALQALLA